MSYPRSYQNPVSSVMQDQALMQLTQLIIELRREVSERLDKVIETQDQHSQDLEELLGLDEEDQGVIEPNVVGGVDLSELRRK